MHPRIALLIGAAALAVGAIGPWATALGIASVGPTANAEVTVVVFGGIALVAFSAITLRAMRGATIVVGLAALAESVYALVSIQQAKADADEWGALIQPGWGLYLTIIAGLYLIASTFIARRVEVEPEPEPA